MRAQGLALQGIRLDSGDLAFLSKEGRRLLDEAGFPDVTIVASNDLDEYLIESLKLQGARIDTWGIGTRLVTAYDQPALGGVFKLAALRRPDRSWDYKLKLSEQLVKISTPGIQQVRRYYNQQGFIADMIYSEDHPVGDKAVIIDPSDPTKRRTLAAGTAYEDILVPVFRLGTLVYALPDLPVIQERACRQISQLHETIRRFLNPHVYPVGLEAHLHAKKMHLILALREAGKQEAP
jgi:nicotinate phosphoribosyltransferase